MSPHLGCPCGGVIVEHWQVFTHATCAFPMPAATPSRDARPVTGGLLARALQPVAQRVQRLTAHVAGGRRQRHRRQ